MSGKRVVDGNTMSGRFSLRARKKVVELGEGINIARPADGRVAGRRGEAGFISGEGVRVCGEAAVR
jgi:hypothetical protein